jgi:hypothetical protein
LASLIAVHFKRLGRAASGFEEIDFQPRDNILPGTWTSAPLSEHVAKKASSEQVGKVRHDVFGVSEVMDAGVFHASVSVAIVSCSLFLIGENLVRFGGFLKPAFGCFITRILVRVEF